MGESHQMVSFTFDAYCQIDQRRQDKMAGKD